MSQAYRICVYSERRVGQFVPAGVPLVRVSKLERVPADGAFHLIAAFDIGPTRTMQQDVEFGIIQIVDIALRAMSPAVNDPSTAISCVDQLSRIIILWISRMPPPSHYYAPPHVLRLFVPWMSFDGLLDTAFEQIRHYAAADVAVSLRLMRAFNDIASATGHADFARDLSNARGGWLPGVRAFTERRVGKITGAPQDVRDQCRSRGLNVVEKFLPTTAAEV